MSRIRGKDTKPELIVRKLLRQAGRGYRLHAADLPGRPDIVFRGPKKAVFVNGCFFHRHKGCRLATMPSTRREFWLAKFEATVERDRAALARLDANGWRTLTVWECEISDTECLRAKLLTFLEA